MILGIVLFALAIFVAVLLHEAGHFLTAKAFRMRVTQFFAGFGPTLWSFRHGDTEYGVKAIPAGGFVKIVGMTSLEELDEQDDQRAFYRQPAPRRLVVLAAGSAVHFLLAFVTLYAIVLGFGLPTHRPALAQVPSCVPRSVTVANPDPACTARDPASPARLAGLRAGDQVVGFAGRPIATETQLLDAVRHRPPGPVSLTVLRAGHRITTTVRLVAVERPGLANPNRTETVSAMGVVISRVIDRPGPIGAVAGAGNLTGQLVSGSLGALGRFPARLPALWDAVFGAPRSANTPVSVVGAARLGGEAVAANQIPAVLGLFAALNVFIGIFNLLPLLPLDGGHIAILLFEQARSALARLVGRRDPGRVDIRKLLPATYVVIVVFGAVSVLAVIADIVNPIANPFQ